MGKHGQYGALVALLLAGPAAAECRLALALGMDVSRSIDRRDYEIERAGLIAALRSSPIREAFLRPEGHVVFALYEWSGEGMQSVILPWTEVHGAADIDRIIGVVAGHKRDPRQKATALGDALVFGRAMLGEAGVCASYTLDISGDGQNNQGPGPDRIYETVDFTGVTVNGLAIGSHERGLVDYYETQVIRGPGAFVVSSPAQKDFPAAIRKKLEKELQVKLIGQVDGGQKGG